jgi:hypothetical protein
MPVIITHSPQARLLWMLAFLLLNNVSIDAESSTCPCKSTDNGDLDVYRDDGQLYFDDHAYPNDYGKYYTTTNEKILMQVL